MVLTSRNTFYYSGQDGGKLVRTSNIDHQDRSYISTNWRFWKSTLEIDFQNQFGFYIINCKTMCVWAHVKTVEVFELMVIHHQRWFIKDKLNVRDWQIRTERRPQRRYIKIQVWTSETVVFSRRVHHMWLKILQELGNFFHLNTKKVVQN